MSLFFQWDTSEKKASNSTRKSWKTTTTAKKQQQQQQRNKKQNKKQLKKLKSHLELIDYSLTNYIKTIDVFKYTRPIK